MGVQGIGNANFLALILQDPHNDSHYPVKLFIPIFLPDLIFPIWNITE